MTRRHQPALSLSKGLPLWLAAGLAVASPLTARIWVDTQGRAIDAEMIEASDTGVSLRRADGEIFVVPMADLSAADRAYAREQPAYAPDKIGMPGKLPPTPTFAQLNELLGVPLFASDYPGSEAPAEVARRLKLAPEAGTAQFASFRGYFSPGQDVLGRPADTLALNAKGNHPTEFSIEWSDNPLAADPNAYTPAFQRAFDRQLQDDFRAIAQLLTGSLGAPRREIPVAVPVGDLESLAWNWKSHTLRLSHLTARYVSLRVSPAGPAQAKNPGVAPGFPALSEHVTHRSNGDTIIGQVPMFTGGPKHSVDGASLERFWRYNGLEGDRDELEALVDGYADGRSLLWNLAASVGPLLRMQGRQLAPLNLASGPDPTSWPEPLLQAINTGHPILWLVQWSGEFNRITEGYSGERAKVSDWGAWKRRAAAVGSVLLEKGKSELHVCLIIGYNRATGEIAFTDSWDSGDGERWVPLRLARSINTDAWFLEAADR
jgi:hypothetical protein